MGLYLAVFDGDEELEGVEVGSYADYGNFRGLVAKQVEGGVAGSRFPTLMSSSDCEGSFSTDQADLLRAELEVLARELRALPPLEPKAGSWQAEVVRSLGLRPQNLFESIFDVDGEPLVERLENLARVSITSGKPILFQ